MNKYAEGSYASSNSYAVCGPAVGYQAWVGREVTVAAPFPVNHSQIAMFAAAVEDPNENYWDVEAAQKRYGSIISPGGMLHSWVFPAPWNPNGRPEHGPLFCMEVPLPGSKIINASTDTTFFDPILVGDHLNFLARIARR